MEGILITGLRLPLAAFRDLVLGRSVHASTGVVTGTRAACGKRMLCLVAPSIVSCVGTHVYSNRLFRGCVNHNGY